MSRSCISPRDKGRADERSEERERIERTRAAIVQVETIDALEEWSERCDTIVCFCDRPECPECWDFCTQCGDLFRPGHADTHRCETWDIDPNGPCEQCGSYGPCFGDPE